MIDPRRIIPLHKVKRKRDLRLLTAVMRDEGWTERPILVEQIRPGLYQAWTGTHRLAAARRARLRRVPVLLVDLKKWVRRYGPYETFAVDHVEKCEDEEKWELLVWAGDTLAADLMREEIEINESATAQGFV